MLSKKRISIITLIIFLITFILTNMIGNMRVNAKEIGTNTSEINCEILKSQQKLGSIEMFSEQKYIYKNLDSRYVKASSDKDIKPLNVIKTKLSLCDKVLAEKVNNVYDLINDTDGDGQVALISTLEDEVFCYGNDKSEYYVMNTSYLHNYENKKLFACLFAHNNNEGEMINLDNTYFDEQTGLSYIKKSEFRIDNEINEEIEYSEEESKENVIVEESDNGVKYSNGAIIYSSSNKEHKPIEEGNNYKKKNSKKLYNSKDTSLKADLDKEELSKEVLKGNQIQLIYEVDLEYTHSNINVILDKGKFEKELDTVKTITLDNIFDTTIMIPVCSKNADRFEKKDFDLYINGVDIKLPSELYDYNEYTGCIEIYRTGAITNSVYIKCKKNSGFLSKLNYNLFSPMSVEAKPIGEMGCLMYKGKAPMISKKLVQGQVYSFDGYGVQGKLPSNQASDELFYHLNLTGGGAITGQGSTNSTDTQIWANTLANYCWKNNNSITQNTQITNGIGDKYWFSLDLNSLFIGLNSGFYNKDILDYSSINLSNSSSQIQASWDNKGLLAGTCSHITFPANYNGTDKMGNIGQYCFYSHNNTIVVRPVVVANGYTILAWTYQTSANGTTDASQQGGAGLVKVLYKPLSKLTITKTIATNEFKDSKLYTPEGTTFKIYPSKTDAKKDTNALGEIKCNAKGKGTCFIDGDKVEILDEAHKNIYIVETKAGGGLALPSGSNKFQPNSPFSKNIATYINSGKDIAISKEDSANADPVKILLSKRTNEISDNHSTNAGVNVGTPPDEQKDDKVEDYETNIINLETDTTESEEMSVTQFYKEGVDEYVTKVNKAIEKYESQINNGSTTVDYNNSHISNDGEYIKGYYNNWDTTTVPFKIKSSTIIDNVMNKHINTNMFSILKDSSWKDAIENGDKTLAIPSLPLPLFNIESMQLSSEDLKLPIYKFIDKYIGDKIKVAKIDKDEISSISTKTIADKEIYTYKDGSEISKVTEKEVYDIIFNNGCVISIIASTKEHFENKEGNKIEKPVGFDDDVEEYMM